jgi:hypothetical protein
VAVFQPGDSLESGRGFSYNPSSIAWGDAPSQRQYFPKGTDLSTHREADLNIVAHRLNRRFRKTLGHKTPADMLATILAPTA